MKETGLMFKAPLVQAILSGQKTQTRRIAKTEITMGRDSLLAPHRGRKYADVYLLPERAKEALVLCPFGKVGDRIYVRETFNHFELNENFKPGCKCFYRADGDCVDLQPWRPAIHMPKHAARIWLEITGVRLERLQAITDADALAEGVDRTNTSLPGYARERFRKLWDGLNADSRPVLPENQNSKRYARVKKWLDTHPDNLGWAANPWVWTIDFQPLSHTGKPQA